jgi:DNA repair photolyase
MRVLLESGVGVEFVTKGAIPGRFLDLFRRHCGCVSGQIGLTTLDESLRAALEPGAAPVGERLANVSCLKEAGVSVAVRADPLIHGVTDGDGNVTALMAACRQRGVTVMAVSYLFLRPAIVASLKRHSSDRTFLKRILAPYAQGRRFDLRGGAGGGVALPEAIRSAAYKRLARLGTERGLQVHVCSCKNPDVASGRCHLVRTANADEQPDRPQTAPRLLWELPPST